MPTLVGKCPLVKSDLVPRLRLKCRDREALGQKLSAVPTGTPIRDIRDQLLDAAERVLLSDGPDALTSRAVTTEAGVAKGILHRHFANFDTFLATLVLAHVDRVDALSIELRASAGTATLTDNLTRALAAALKPSAVAIVSLVSSRDELLARLRLAEPAGVPLLAETTRMIAAYLTAERGLGRIAIETDVDTLGVILVGTAHLLAVGSRPAPLERDDLRPVVSLVVENFMQQRPTRAAQT